MITTPKTYYFLYFDKLDAISHNYGPNHINSRKMSILLEDDGRAFS